MNNDKCTDVAKAVAELNAIHDVFVAARTKPSVIVGPESFYVGDDPALIAAANDLWNFICSEKPDWVN